MSASARAVKVREAAQLLVETRANIAKLQARLGTATIYVTHDQVETTEPIPAR
jgi:ABC-type sugar transport system ATPase subunit